MVDEWIGPSEVVLPFYAFFIRKAYNGFFGINIVKPFVLHENMQYGHVQRGRKKKPCAEHKFRIVLEGNVERTARFSNQSSQIDIQIAIELYVDEVSEQFDDKQFVALQKTI
jgi:hypothetical protein